MMKKKEKRLKRQKLIALSVLVGSFVMLTSDMVQYNIMFCTKILDVSKKLHAPFNRDPEEAKKDFFTVFFL